MDEAAVFYLHEDDWGMVSLLPAENMEWAEQVADEAARAAASNFAGFVDIGGFQVPTYRDAYVIPPEKYPISGRSITLADLRSMVAATWSEAASVESGYSTHAETIGGGFAFGRAYSESGAFYGSHKDGIVTQLHVSLPYSADDEARAAFAETLAKLANKYNLVLADWSSKGVVELRDPARLKEYLAGDD